MFCVSLAELCVSSLVNIAWELIGSLAGCQRGLIKNWIQEDGKNKGFFKILLLAVQIVVMLRFLMWIWTVKTYIKVRRWGTTS